MTLLVLAAALPILLVLIGFVRGMASWHVGLLALVATGVLANAFFHVSLPAIGQAVGTALFPMFETIGILGPALFLSTLERAGGGMACLTALARQRSERDLLVLFLVLGLSPFLEAICGFGTGMVVCVPLYLTLEIPPQKAAVLGLLGESTTAFASMGNAVTLEASLTGLPADTLGMASALLVLPLTCGCAALALFLVGGNGAFRRWGLVAGLAALLLIAGEWGGSALGVGSAGVLSSLLISSLLGGLLWRRTRTSVSERQSQARQARGWVRLLVPCLILLSGQLLTREIAPLSNLAARTAVSYGGQRWVIAEYPGAWLLLACLSAVLLFNDRRVIGNAWKQTQKRLFPLATTIGAFLVISALMHVSGMMETLAALFLPVASMYVGVAPLLGALGSWMTGSNTSSNALFALLQTTLAQQFHLSALWIGAAQNAAASVGRLVAPLCLYLATSSAGVSEQALVLPAWRLVLFALISMEGILAILFPSVGMMALVGTPVAGAVLLWGVQRFWRWHTVGNVGKNKPNVSNV